MLDTTHMDVADLEGTLADVPVEMRYELALRWMGQYMGTPQAYDEFLIIRTRVVDLNAHHTLHDQMTRKIYGMKGFRNVLSSLTYRPGVDDKLGWYAAGRTAIRKRLNGTARAFGERIR